MWVLGGSTLDTSASGESPEHTVTVVVESGGYHNLQNRFSESFSGKHAFKRRAMSFIQYLVSYHNNDFWRWLVGLLSQKIEDELQQWSSVLNIAHC